MPPIFSPTANTIARATLLGLAALVALLGCGWWVVARSPYVTREAIPVEQPVPFSHRHHVTDDGLDCRYCHTAVEESSFAGIPPTETCMNCHKQLWIGSSVLEPVRRSYAAGQPIRWARVNYLPDFIYFNHSIHVHKGVGCAECHGRVDRMPLVYQRSPMQMRWCLECHRDPAPRLRPREAIYEMAWSPPADPSARRELGQRLLREYAIASEALLTSCSTCHR